MKSADITALKQIGIILVVDDEPLVRRGLIAILHELFIEGSGPAIREAEDGERAVEIIRHEPTGVVFTDIKMPNMDGLALLSWISVNNPDCQTVVLSCHDDYDFVRQAFQHKVMDYILKYDIDREGVENILLNVLKIRGKPQTVKPATPIEPLSRQAAFTQWLTSIEPNLPEQAYYRLIACVVHSRPAKCLITEHAALRILEAVADSLNMDDVFQVCYISTGCMLILHGSQYEETHNEIRSLSAVVKQRFDAAAGEDVSLLVSEQHRWVRSLGELYKTLLPLVRHSFFRGPGIYFSIDYEKLYQSYPEAWEELLPEFKVEAYALLREGSFPSLRSRLQKLGVEIEKTPGLDIDTVKAFYRDLADIIAVSCRDSLLGDVQRTTMKEIQEKVDHAKSFTELEQAVGNLINANSNLNGVGDFSIGIRRALACIHANFEKKSFSLTDVAEQLNYSHSYLSRQFKKELGVNIVTYINNLRLTEAKRLLASGRYLVYEIADQVGFNNYNYFSKVYKKCFGVSPANDDQ